MIAKLLPNRVRRTYLGGGQIDAFTGEVRSCATAQLRLSRKARVR